jgi:hypothetical protein
MVVLQNFPSQLEVNAAGNGDYSHIISYVFIIGMVITLLTQTHLLNMAIMHGDTLTVFPFFQVRTERERERETERQRETDRDRQTDRREFTTFSSAMSC